jgi:glycerol-3-phosphate dehydrogenase
VFSWRERQKWLNTFAPQASSHEAFLKDPSETKAPLSHTHRGPRDFDICVIGGGITGGAIAREAAAAGLKTLLLEKNDFAWGTSSRSSKLVHGGVRYLENLEFKLVAESTLERSRLWKVAPDLVKPLAFLFPAYKNSRLPLWMLNIGLWLYDILSLFSSPTLHKKLGAEKTSKLEPALRSQELKGSIYYWDAETDDSLLTLSNILDAHKLGAVCLNKSEVTRIEWNSLTPHVENAFHKVIFTDKNIHTNGSKNGDFEIYSKVIVSAAGPWTDELFTKTFHLPSHRMATTRGSHIVVSKEKIPLNHAVVMTHPKDGRVLFGIPWPHETVIGTTDVFDQGNPDKTVITSEEVHYLIQASQYFFPRYPIHEKDILSVWSGLRPLLAPPKNASASEISREHSIEWFNPGCLVIAGGKLTTHRVMAVQTLERILRETNMWEVRLFKNRTGLSTKFRNFPKLVQTGSRNITREMILEICQNQMVLTLEDFLVRRTDFFYWLPQNGLEKLDELKSPLCDFFNWTQGDWQRQVENYKDYLKTNMDIALNRSRD